MRPSPTTIAGDALLSLFISMVGIVSPMKALDMLHHEISLRRQASLSAAQRQKARQTFSYLLRNEYIYFEERKGAVVLCLTSKGKKKAQAKALPALIPSLSSRTSQHWDRKWRVILFDIPAHERAKRNALRTLLRKLGATLLQKSVWIYPYDCEKELQVLADYFELSPRQLRRVIAEDIGDEHALKKRYKLD